MRLVDADVIEKQFDPDTWQGEMMIAITRDLPTAYDVDEIVKQLMECTYHHDGYTAIDSEEAIDIVKGKY